MRCVLTTLLVLLLVCDRGCLFAAKLKSNSIISRWPKIDRDAALARRYDSLARVEQSPRKLHYLWNAFHNEPGYFLSWLSAWEIATAPPSNQTVSLPTFSVVLPCYNCAKTLPATLDSLRAALALLYSRCALVVALKKKHPPQGEIIIVNDGSTDQSAALIQEFIDSSKSSGGYFDHITFVFLNEEDNTGYGPARNKALKRVHNELVMFLDSDDLYKDVHLYFMLVVAALSQAPHVWSEVETSEPIHPQHKAPISTTHLMGKAIRREVLDLMPEFPDMGKLDEFGHVGGEDGIFVMGLMKFFPDFVTVPHATAVYCRHPGNNFDLQFDKWQLPPNEDGTIPDLVNTNRERMVQEMQSLAWRKYFPEWERKFEAMKEAEAAVKRTSRRSTKKRDDKDEL